MSISRCGAYAGVVEFRLLGGNIPMLLVAMCVYGGAFVTSLYAQQGGGPRPLRTPKSRR